MQVATPTPNVTPPPREALPRPSALLEVVYGVLVLAVCLFILRKTSPSSFKPSVRQENRALFERLDEMKALIPDDARVYVLTQDPSPHNLLWRKVCYGLIPRRGLCLPRNLRPADTVPPTAVNPASGTEATIGEIAAFTDAKALGGYLRAMNVTHMVVLSGDEPAAVATDLPLTPERMYLLALDASTGKLTEVSSAERP